MATEVLPIDFKEKTPANGVFNVVIPGIFAGGEVVTWTRKYLHEESQADGIVLSSMSRREALKKDHSGLDHYYSSVVDHITAQPHDRYRFFVHSLGGLESLDIFKQLSDRKAVKQKKVDIIFASPAGMGQEKIGGLIETGRRVIKLNVDMAKKEEEYVYPYIPENQQNDSPEEKSQLKIVRRHRFLYEWLPNLIPDIKSRARFIQHISEIDSEITHLENFSKHDFKKDARHALIFVDGQKKRLEKLRRERTKQIGELIVNGIFQGRHVDPESHNKYIQLAKELPEYIIESKKYQAVATLFMARCLGRLYRGFDNEMIPVLKNLKEAADNLTVGCVVATQDLLSFRKDAEAFQQKAKKQGVDIWIKEIDAAHTTFGFDAETLNILRQMGE